MDLSIGTHDTTDSTESDDIAQASDRGDSVSGMSLESTNQYLQQVDNGDGEISYRMVQLGDNSQQIVVPVSLGGQMLPQLLPIEDPTPISLQTPHTGIGTNSGHAQIVNQGGLPQVIQTSAGMMVASVSQDDMITQVAGNGGSFYVMVSPQDATGELDIRQSPGGGKLMQGRVTRDDRRRASHNEVERRRRDKMNYWIIQLSKMVPGCAEEAAASANSNKNPSAKSKGGILEKACEYIEELQNSNANMGEAIKEAQIVATDNELLKAQIEELQKQNIRMKKHLEDGGVIVTHEIVDEPEPS